VSQSSNPVASVAPREHIAAGILWMLATMFCFIALDAVMKYLLQFHPLVQVTWARFFFATMVAAIACGGRLPALAKSRMPGAQLTRSSLLMVTTGLFNAGIRTVPLATATTIMFLSPILVTVLSIPMLGEKVGVRRWAGVIVGFIGAMIVVKPWEAGLGGLGAGALFLLAACFSNATYQIVTRRVRGDDPMTSLLYTAAAGAVVTSSIVPWHWSSPSAFHWMLFVASGLLGGIGHLCLIRAFRVAPASTVVPFSYSALVWSTLFGIVIFHEFPGDYWTWAGAALIIASGLYIFHRERQLGKADENG
jgi:drug/metabolite transporter (DMT)-like permease